MFCVRLRCSSPVSPLSCIPGRILDPNSRARLYPMVREEQRTTGCRSNKTQPRQICSREWQTGRIVDESILAASQWNKTFCFLTREKPVHHDTYVHFIRINQFLCKQMITISIFFFFCFPLEISPRFHNYSFYSNICILITTSLLIHLFQEFAISFSLSHGESIPMNSIVQLWSKSL